MSTQASPDATAWHAEAQTDRIAHVVAGDGTLLAVVVDGIGEPGRALPWARLMAAAPDLADACEAMVDLLQNGERSVPEILSRCKAALAQARGEQP